MLTIQQKSSINCPYPLEKLAPLSDLLFFDIETTGFQADVSSLYLIGCMYFEQNTLHFIQWFADNYRSEVDIIHAFFSLLEEHRTLIHFNGNRFDIPYIQKKCSQYHLPYTFDHCISIDLFKKIKPYKKLFQLENYKQKTIEQFLQIPRTDPYNGGELIQVYGDYIKAKVAYKDTSPYLEPLLLHNKEDLEGMIGLTGILHYIDIFEQDLSLLWFNQTDLSLEAILKLPCALPTPISIKKDGYQISLKEDRLFLSMEYYKGELKYFYPDYHNYYYLPAEDIAIHKSVASFVDKEYRVKATRANCYLKKTGCFIPINEGIDGYTPFKMAYDNPQTYMEISDEVLSDTDAFAKLMNQLIKSFLIHY